MKPILVALVSVLALAAPAVAQPLVKVPPGFKAEIILQAPDIEAPTALAVPANGDVYFAEDPMDMRGPSNKNIDKIWLLKGGDPKKRILFAENLWAVMGMEIVRDKLYVVHYPYISVFTLNADGSMKERKDLFTDCGPKSAPPGGFNDHVPSGIRMGMDGWLYVSIGDKGIPKMTRKEKGSVHIAEGRTKYSPEGNHLSLEGGGIIRFRPDGSRLEVFASGTRNHLDVPMDEHDRIFLRDNTDDGDGWDTRFMYVIPGGFYGYPWAFTRHPKEVVPMIRDFGGGSPCQGWVYTDDGLPETFRGRIFHCEWGKGKVLAVKVAPEGAGFKFVNEIAFMDPSGTGVKDFRPYTLRPTADGRGFYVTDWGYSGWQKAIKAGRIWKVTYVKDDVKPAPRGKDRDSIDDLIKSLDHPAHSERLRAQRELEKRGNEVPKRMVELIRANKLTLSPQQRRHMIWAVSVQEPKEVVEWCFDIGWNPEPSVRLQVVRVLASLDPGKLPEKAMKGEVGQEVYRAMLLDYLEEYHPASLRLQAVVACKRILNGDAVIQLLKHYSNTNDPYLRFAILDAVRQAPSGELSKKLTPKWLSAAKSQLLEGLILALEEKFDTEIVAILKRLGDHPDTKVRTQAIEGLARTGHDRKPYAGGWWGTRPEKQQPPARTVAWEGTPVVRDALLKALADSAAEVRKAAVDGLLTFNDPALLPILVKRFEQEKSGEVRVDLVRVIGNLKAAGAVDFLATALQDAKNPQELRLAAIAAMAKVNTPTATGHIAKVVAPGESAEVQVAGLKALGNSKDKKLASVCQAALKSPLPPVKQAAAAALGQLNAIEAAPALVSLLTDKNVDVRSSAIQALGNLKAIAAIPELLKAANQEATQFDAIGALAKMPDVRALTAYLTGLSSKSVDLRTASRQAITAIREQAAPVLEQLVKGNEIRSELLPELRSIYNTYAPIMNWKLIGPFPNDGKAYPPEKELQFDKTYAGMSAKVKWRDRKADAKFQGKINLLTLYKPNMDVIAYGYAEIESPTDHAAQLQVGSDDSIVIWLNGQKVHEFLGDRGWQYNSDVVKVTLKAGKNQLLIKCGQHGGDWAFSVAVSGDSAKYAFLKGGAKKYDLDAFRAFARKTKGDVERGRKLFFDMKGLACIKCHGIGGQGGVVGPDLAGISLRYNREDLMTSILEPSKTIAQGYETVVITTGEGKIITGVFKGERDEVVSLMDAEGKLHQIAKKDIDDRRISPISTMPNGLNEGMTLQDFADLITYLEARREEKTAPIKGKEK